HGASSLVVPPPVRWQLGGNPPGEDTPAQERGKTADHDNRHPCCARCLSVATTLRNAKAFSKEDLATLYRTRWHAELALRALKPTGQRDILRRNPRDLVRKDLCTHILAPTLILTFIPGSATHQSIDPGPLSVKGALPGLEASPPVLDLLAED